MFLSGLKSNITPQSYNQLLNFVLALAGTVVYVNLVVALAIPQHWCFVPGREFTNDTIGEWKRNHLPRLVDSHANEVYSSCFMYGMNHSDKIRCTNGYEYSQIWFKNTLISSEDWVCKDSINLANLVALTKTGEVIGYIFSMYKGNELSHAPLFSTLLALMVITRTIMPFSASYYSIFVSLSMSAAFASSILVKIILEGLRKKSHPEEVQHLNFIHNLGWCIGNCLLPLLYWWINDWVSYIYVTTIPLWIYCIVNIFIVEWQKGVSRKTQIKSESCFERKEELMSLKQENISPQNQSISYLLISSRITGFYMLLILGWITTLVSYTTLFFSAVNLSGNPYWNFFIQSLAEIPAFYCANMIGNRLGRRFSSVIGFAAATCCFMGMIVSLNGETAQIILSAIARFAISVSYFTVNLRASELFPKCEREKTNSLGLIIGNGFGILSPYIVHLGRVYSASSSILILIILTLIGGLSSIILPETLNEDLPTSLFETENFGKDQKFWQFKIKQKTTVTPGVQLNAIEMT